MVKLCFFFSFVIFSHLFLWVFRKLREASYIEGVEWGYVSFQTFLGSVSSDGILRHRISGIVKTYYGGRDISHKDLEAALLVGMSPHERRKFEKKRGLSNKHSAASVLSDKIQENYSDNISRDVNHYSVETSSVHGSLDTKDQASSQQLINKLEADVGNPSLSSELEVKDNASTINGISLTLDSNGISDIKDVNLLDAENNLEARNPLNGIADQCAPYVDGGKYNSKVSLLGHGPHGKEVVTHLLKNYGEDGICQFCQRWRQVFVDAVNPRYLPAGWDIKHSGRRDFGEFSVYNPVKKHADANEE